MLEIAEPTKQVVKPTKQFLINQIEALRVAMAQNQGAINLLVNMLNAGCYIEEEETKNGSPNSVDE